MAISPGFDMAKLTAELATDEGMVLKPYVDTRGKITIGIGRNLTDNGITAVECSDMLAHDIQTACDDLDRHALWWRHLPPAQQRVMINLSFNMGWPTLAGFRHFLAAMEARDWTEAANQLRNSLWWRQVGTRGPRIAARLMGDAA